MNTPVHFFKRGSTSGRCTIWGNVASRFPLRLRRRTQGSPEAFFRRLEWHGARRGTSLPDPSDLRRRDRPLTCPSPGLSTSAASNGGDDHSAGSACFTSYMKYRPTVRGAPASSVAKMPGWPSVGTLLTWNPASRSMLMVSSQPSFMPRFSAAMEGWRIQVCSRFTVSSWRLVISAAMASRSPAAARKA